MANINCSACDDLRQEAPSVIVNGLGDEECASLQNGTGLSASSDNDNCEDLNNLNDCLIGNLGTEVDAYDVCEWKEFMKKFIPNLWTTLKAIICAVCGVWKHLNGILESVNDLCALVNQVVSPALVAYGRLPLAASADHRCGVSTGHVAARPDDGTLNPYTKTSQNIGIRYASMTVRACNSDKKVMLEWIMPDAYLYKLKSGVESGDILWKISKTDAQSIIGISDFLWTLLTQSSWTWRESALSTRQMAWLKLTVGTDGLTANELGVVFMGCTAPNTAISSDVNIEPINDASARCYRHVVD